MMKKASSLLLSLLMLSIIMPLTVQAQGDESFRVKLESILNRYKNYRFSTIDVYSLKDVRDVRQIIKDKEQAENTTAAVGDADKIIAETDPQVVSTIRNLLLSGSTKTKIRRELIGRFGEQPKNFDALVEILSPNKGSQQVVREAYVITTKKADRDQVVPNTIIAMIVSMEDNTDIKKNVDNASGKNIYTWPELVQYDLDPEKYNAENLYQLLENAFMQSNVEKRTSEAQGIGTMKKWTDPQYGVSRSLIEREGDISSSDVQKFVRISNAEPIDYNKNHEIVVSPDLVSWKRYEIETYTYEDGYVDTLSFITNSSLPKFGLELKYGIDEINMPSMYSERMTFSALWENMKIGAILPTSGWSKLGQDMLDYDRVFTYGGLGLAGSLDFPFKVIPQSGVFHLSFGWVFGDAERADYKDKLDLDNVMFVNPEDESGNDYLVRANATLHYTFGLAIDKDYQMRFGLGGTVYTIETWADRLESDPETNIETAVYKEVGKESIGGISAKMDFMVKNISTPYGVTAQYFDESIYASAWIHIPIIKDLFALRLEGKSYFAAFKDSKKPWEKGNDNLFIPMARFIFVF